MDYMKNLKSKDIYESVKKIYFDILHREPDSDGLEYWSNILKEKTMTIEEIKSEFYNSQEFEQLDPKYNFSNEKDPPKGFFDDYPIFFQTSKTVEHPNHLNGRFKAIIESNSDIIKNSSILDIASHDGRWSFAALKNGAKNVLGIEAREYLVKNSYQNMITYKIEPPSTPRPTTLRPITDPPVKATFNAFAKLVLAAFVVLLLALVATLIPKNPAKPDVMAPTKNEIATNQESPCVFAANANKQATISMKIAKIRYSAFKNAIAPLAILAPICFILSEPSSCLFIQFVFQNENKIASIPAHIT